MLDFVLPDVSWRVKNVQKLFSNYLKDKNLQNQTIFELYTDDNKTKYSSNPKEILKSAKKSYERLYTQETSSKAASTEFLSKVPNRNKRSNEQFTLCEAKISLDEIIKSKNSQANGCQF